MRYSRQDRSVRIFRKSWGFEIDILTIISVRSREGRRNRAPPPRVRYNKDGKKVNPQQAAQAAGGAGR